MGKQIDLTGRRFTRLLVKSEAESKIRKDGHKNRMWNCLCDCGQYTIASTASLMSGNTQSCGCYKIDKIRESHNKCIVGKTYNDIGILEEAGFKTVKSGKNKGTKKKLLKCKCYCGNIFYTTQDQIVSGHTKSCGCKNAEAAKQKMKDLTGNLYGMLFVESFSRMKQTKSGHNIAYWNCICSCGEKVEVSGIALKNGYTTSCGCQRKRKLRERLTIDLSNQRIGILNIRNQIFDDALYKKYKCALWNCSCDCGVDIILPSVLIFSRKIPSCGCLNSMSSGEKTIKQYLLQNNIRHTTEYTFDDLLGFANMPLRFDFAILGENNQLLGLIEYQGEQHYVEKSDNFGYTQRTRTDPQKKEYCKIHNILLYEIRYDEDINEKMPQIIYSINSHVNPVPSSD